MKPRAKQRPPKTTRSLPGPRRSSAAAGHPSALLRGISLFAKLSDTELDQIAERVIFKQYKKNSIILREEMTSEIMYIILEGEVKVVRAMEEGKEIIVSMHSSGEFFGELSLMDGKTTPATVIATKDSSTALITKAEFFSLIFGQRKVMENFLKILCTRLRDSISKIELLNFNSAAQRVKMLFMMMAETYGERTPAGTVLNIRLLHQDIADMVGLTRETVTRVLDRMKKSGEIELLNRKRIRLNPDFESINIANTLPTRR
jgi:CRP/FNR family cyclic AMP-dependent transcriptional regulator